MKRIILLTMLFVILTGCSNNQDQNTDNNTQLGPNGTQDLVLNEQELAGFGLTSNGCLTEGDYTNVVDSTQGQYTFCNYTHGDTEILMQLQKYANYEALNGSYQYDSLHYFSIQGLISENTIGDQSRFRVNNENDYGGQYNPPGVYFYHLWTTKDLYLIHITSSGREQSANETIMMIGQKILSKFG